MSRPWTLDDIPWGKFDRSKVDPAILKVVKAASLVEYNGEDYGRYLRHVFCDDSPFCRAATTWAREEVRHGDALRRWAELADPAFDFDASFKRFTDGYQLPLEPEMSVRGSRSGELVARCIVETGTSSFYAALAAATEEPVLEEICRNISADELRHYRLFYDYLRRYLKRERIGRWRRLWVALGRICESEDDELAYAYFAANSPGGVYDRKQNTGRALATAFGYYGPRDMQQVVAMVLKAVGLRPDGRLCAAISRLAYGFLRLRRRQLERAAA